MNARQRRRLQRLHEKAIANNLILFRLLGGHASMVQFYSNYTPRMHGLLLEHIKKLQERP